MRKSRFFGFVDQICKEVMAPAYLHASSFSESLAPVQLHGASGYVCTFIDRAGSLHNTFYKQLRNLSQGFAVATMENGRQAFVDRNLEIVLGPFVKAADFNEGVACVESDGHQKFIDRNGQAVFENQWDWISTACFENRIVFSKNGRQGFVDKNGVVVVPAIHTSVGFFTEGVAIVEKDNVKSAVDQQGNILFEGEFQWLGSFRDGLAKFQRNDLWGFVNKSGTVVIENSFSWVGDFREGVAPVCPAS